MYLSEYDEKKHMALEREEWRKEGQKEGIDTFARLILALTKDNRQADITRAASDNHYRQKLFEEYKID